MVCQPMPAAGMCENGAQLARSYYVSNPRGGDEGGEPLWRESCRLFFKHSITKIKNSRLELPNAYISLSSLLLVCWISNSSHIGFLACAFSMRLFSVCAAPRKAKVAAREPWTRAEVPFWSLVTRPHLQSRFFSGKS